MKKHVTYFPDGVCSRVIDFDIIDGHVYNVVFTGGCRGNTTGVSRLSEGMSAEEIVKRLKNINCREGNSCPHQFALAVEANLKEI